MLKSNAKQSFNSDNSEWVLLSELPSIDFLLDQDRREESLVRSLFQTLQELGMLPKDMDNIARTLTDIAKEASVRTKNGRLEVPRRIRIFCQKKILADANIAKALRHPQAGMEQKQNFLDSRTNTIGGWGYFMIERGEDLLPQSPALPYKYAGLYLYREGD